MDEKVNDKKRLAEQIDAYIKKKSTWVEHLEVGSKRWWEHWSQIKDPQRLEHYLKQAQSQGVNINDVIALNESQKGIDHGKVKYSYALMIVFESANPHALNVLLSDQSLDVKKSLYNYIQMKKSTSSKSEHFDTLVRQWLEDQTSTYIWEQMQISEESERVVQIQELTESVYKVTPWAAWEKWQGYDRNTLVRLLRSYPNSVNYGAMTQMGCKSHYLDQDDKHLYEKIEALRHVVGVLLEHLSATLSWCDPLLGVCKSHVMKKVMQKNMVIPFENYRWHTPESKAPGCGGGQGWGQMSNVPLDKQEAGALIGDRSVAVSGAVPPLEGPLKPSAADAILLSAWALCQILDRQAIDQGVHTTAEQIANKMQLDWMKGLEEARRLMKSGRDKPWDKNEQAQGVFESRGGAKQKRLDSGGATKRDLPVPNATVATLYYQLVYMGLETMVRHNLDQNVLQLCLQVPEQQWSWSFGAPRMPVYWNEKSLERLRQGVMYNHFEAVRQEDQVSINRDLMKKELRHGNASGHKGVMLGVSMGSYCLLYGNIKMFKKMMHIPVFHEQWLNDPVRMKVLSYMMNKSLLSTLKDWMDLETFKDENGQNPMHWCVSKGRLAHAEQFEKIVPRWVMQKDNNSKMPHECSSNEAHQERLGQMERRALDGQIPKGNPEDVRLKSLRL